MPNNIPPLTRWYIRDVMTMKPLKAIMILLGLSINSPSVRPCGDTTTMPAINKPVNDTKRPKPTIEATFRLRGIKRLSWLLIPRKDVIDMSSDERKAHAMACATDVVDDTTAKNAVRPKPGTRTRGELVKIALNKVETMTHIDTDATTLS